MAAADTLALAEMLYSSVKTQKREQASMHSGRNLNLHRGLVDPAWHFSASPVSYPT